MPITAKLSRAFYEKFGDEVTSELVNWLNAVDDSYRTEFRDLFEAHFGRLEATLARETAELRADLAEHRLETSVGLGAIRGELQAGLAAVGKRMDGLEARFDRQAAVFEERFATIDARFSGLDARFTSLDVRFSSIDERFDRQAATMDLRFDKQASDTRAAIAEAEARLGAQLLKYSIGSVATTVLAIVGIVGALAGFGLI